MNVFATVKTSINTREAAARYGVEVNHHGKALCPFHNDRHPSLFVDDDHYHCYACGEHGDVIDFTSKLYGLSMLDAAKKLAYDFGITQDKPPTKATLEKLNKKSEAQRLKENEKLCFSALLEYMKLLREWMVLYAPRTPEDTPHDRFVQACHHLSYYPINEVTTLLHCGRQKAVDTLRELQYAGLLEIRKQGCGKPNRIYPKWHEAVPDADFKKSDHGTPEG